MYHQNIFLKNRSTGMWLKLLLTGAVFLAPIPALAQDQKQTKSDDQDVIKIASNLVSIDVIVKDKKGKPITDLKAEDFTISENGVAQKIEFFDSTLSSLGGDRSIHGRRSIHRTKTTKADGISAKYYRLGIGWAKH